MAIRDIIRMGHPTLRLIATEFTKEEIKSSQTSELIADMFETMRSVSGLAVIKRVLNYRFPKIP